MLFQDTVILVYAKAPVESQVNTRLIPDIGVQAATTLQHDLIHQRLTMLMQLNLCEVIIMCAPDIQHDVFSQCEKQYSTRLLQQTGYDLGERMANGIDQALQHYKHCVVIGTDAPALDGVKLKQAITALHKKADVVFVPAEDGGYVLVGLNKRYDFLFKGISWGSEMVMQQSKDKLTKNNISFVELAKCWDIDNLVDYKRYLTWRGKH